MMMMFCSSSPLFLTLDDDEGVGEPSSKLNNFTVHKSSLDELTCHGDGDCIFGDCTTVNRQKPGGQIRANIK